MDSNATSSVVQFAIAGALLLASIGGALLATQNVAPEDIRAHPGDARAFDNADEISSILLSNPASGADLDWQLHADDVARFGLLDGDGQLDYAKFEHLRQAPRGEAPDGFLSYEEALAILQMPEGGGFHIRGYPTFVTDRDTLSESGLETHLRVAYIGDWIDEDDVSNDVDDDSQQLVICHKPGTPAAKNLAIPTNAWASHSGHGDTLGACTPDYPEPQDEDPEPSNMTICHKPGTPAEKTKNIPLSAWGGHSGHGDYEGACGDPAYPMDICHQPGTIAQENRTITSSDWDRHEAHGDHDGFCTEAAPDPDAEDGSVGAWSYLVEDEVGALTRIVLNFCPVHANDELEGPSDELVWSAESCDYLSGATLGAVIGDEADILGETLVPLLLDETGEATLAQVSTLVLGSGVDHLQLVDQDLEDAIQEWILAGGTVVSYGSTAQDVEWLDLLFDAGIGTSSGGLQAPDIGHPLLRTPHQLDWDGYAHPGGTAWDLGHDDSYFTHVVSQDESAVLAVSKPGVFGAGNVILTSWHLGDVYEQRPADADALVAGEEVATNLLLLSYRTVYLDYGPEIPDDRGVGASSRQMLLEHPIMGPIPVTVVVYAW